MKQMTEEEQKKVFSKNLKYYLDINEMQQKDLAKIIGVQPSTISNWLSLNSMPQVSTIQKIADYFRIGKTDLVDDKLDGDPELDARIISDTRMVNMIKMFYSLSMSDREAIEQIITSLYEKSKRVTP